MLCQMDLMQSKLKKIESKLLEIKKILISEVKNFLRQGQNNIYDFIKKEGTKRIKSKS